MEGSVLVEKMHTPDTNKYHFSKNIACEGQLSCNFTNKMFTSGIRIKSSQFHIIFTWNKLTSYYWG